MQLLNISSLIILLLRTEKYLSVEHQGLKKDALSRVVNQSPSPTTQWSQGLMIRVEMEG